MTNLLIVIASTVAGLFIGWAFHIAMHHIEFLHSRHKLGHHDVYSKRFKTDEYLYTDSNKIDFLFFKLEVEYLVLLPATLYIAILYLLIPFGVWLICLAIAVGSLALAGYLHTAYHIKNHWLMRYRLFRIAVKHHAEHHANPAVWYGLGISDAFDVLFRTVRR